MQHRNFDQGLFATQNLTGEMPSNLGVDRERTGISKYAPKKAGVLCLA
jgi:hypothetical protein